MGAWAKSPPVCMCACVHVQHLAGELNSTGAVVSDEQGRMLSEVRVCWCHERGGAKTLSIGHTAPGEDMKEPDNKNASKMKRGTCGNTVEF